MQRGNGDEREEMGGGLVVAMVEVCRSPLSSIDRKGSGEREDGPRTEVDRGAGRKEGRGIGLQRSRGHVGQNRTENLNYSRDRSGPVTPTPYISVAKTNTAAMYYLVVCLWIVDGIMSVAGSRDILTCLCTRALRKLQDINLITNKTSNIFN
ncbi:hypothetical protein GWI33_021138 [Rhynchophorus ferrugineus]|uniref:Uncharacterized protein n=1 Tax=Rhynchophorus ferrugineus TaxID=354439 RepID=A0A834M547_RHYFE|nr:hypothetical protein GWI33_021138 [Rhynchophorus ferrugineus]